MLKLCIEDGETFEKVDWLQMPVYFCKIQSQLRVLKSGINCKEVHSDTNYDSNDNWPDTGKVYWHQPNKWYDKKGKPQHVNSGYKYLSYILPDGAIVNYNCYNQIFIDVNGYKKPNTIGRDIFFMTVQTKNMVPTIISQTGSAIIPNGCTVNGSNSTPALTLDNYEEDCKRGTGWGCSLLYLTD